jgi:hypothetical protein
MCIPTEIGVPCAVINVLKMQGEEGTWVCGRGEFIVSVVLFTGERHGYAGKWGAVLTHNHMLNIGDEQVPGHCVFCLLFLHMSSSLAFASRLLPPAFHGVEKHRRQ